jgi:hypothetical protein
MMPGSGYRNIGIGLSAISAEVATADVDHGIEPNHASSPGRFGYLMQPA